MNAETNMLNAPPQIRALPRDEHGTPVPFGIFWVSEGTRRWPNWGMIDPERLARALRRNLCFTCGEPLMLRSYTFVLSMRGALRWRSPFPPNHAQCASYIARHPLARIGPLAYLDPAGLRVVWRCSSYQPVTDRVARCMVFAPAAPNDLYWIVEGRAATREDVLAEMELVDPECYPTDGGLEVARVRYEQQRRLLKRWLPERERNEIRKTGTLKVEQH